MRGLAAALLHHLLHRLLRLCELACCHAAAGNASLAVVLAASPRQQWRTWQQELQWPLAAASPC